MRSLEKRYIRMYVRMLNVKLGWFRTTYFQPQRPLFIALDCSEDPSHPTTHCLRCCHTSCFWRKLDRGRCRHLHKPFIKFADFGFRPETIAVSFPTVDLIRSQHSTANSTRTFILGHTVMRWLTSPQCRHYVLLHVTMTGSLWSSMSMLLRTELQDFQTSIRETSISRRIQSEFTTTTSPNCGKDTTSSQHSDRNLALALSWTCNLFETLFVFRRFLIIWFVFMA